MQKEDIYSIINNNSSFYLATIDGEMPRVRGMMVYRADDNGIVFHTGSMKDVYRQILANANAELCFVDYKQFIQVRISGKLEFVEDNAFKDEIANHPSRGFVREWRDNGSLQDFYKSFIVCRMQGGKAKIWTMETNFEPSQEIVLG